MKRIQLLGLATILTASGGAAFAEPAKKAPEKKEEAPAAATVTKAQADEWLVFFDKLVAIVVANQSDCDKMAKELDAHTEANKDLLAKAQKAQTEGKRLPKAAEEHMAASVQKMM